MAAASAGTAVDSKTAKCTFLTSAKLCAICGTTEGKMKPVGFAPGDRSFTCGGQSFSNRHYTDGSVYVYNTYLCGECSDSMAERPLQKSVVEGIKSLNTPEYKEWLKQRVAESQAKTDVAIEKYHAWVALQQRNKQKGTEKVVRSKK